MHRPIDFDSPALTLGLAPAGRVAEAPTRHLGIPGAVTLLVALLVILLGGAIRQARRRSAELNAALDRALDTHLGAALVRSNDGIALIGGDCHLAHQRLLSLVRRGVGVEAVAAAAGEALRRPLRPLGRPLSLKIHGTRIELHLVNPLVLELGAREPSLARTPVTDLGLVATYRLDGRPEQCVTEGQLQELAIDARDLHGIALAVLRQTLDSRFVTRALAGERLTLESADGRAAAALLVLSDFLPAGSRLAATLEGPDRLTLEPWTEETASGDSGGGGRRLMIRDDGYEIL
jgi:hypothetical protein